MGSGDARERSRSRERDRDRPKRDRDRRENEDGEKKSSRKKSGGKEPEAAAERRRDTDGVAGKEKEARKKETRKEGVSNAKEGTKSAGKEVRKEVGKDVRKESAKSSNKEAPKEAVNKKEDTKKQASQKETRKEGAKDGAKENIKDSAKEGSKKKASNLKAAKDSTREKRKEPTKETQEENKVVEKKPKKKEASKEARVKEPTKETQENKVVEKKPKKKEASKEARVKDPEADVKASKVDMADDPEVLAAASAATASAAAKVDRLVAAAIGKAAEEDDGREVLKEAPRKETPKDSAKEPSGKEARKECAKSRRAGRAAAPDDDSISASGSGDARSSYSGCSRSRSPRQRRDDNGLRGASGFGVKPCDQEAEAAAPSASTTGVPQAAAGANNDALAVLPDKVRGLLNNREGLFQDVLKLKQAVEVAQGPVVVPKPEPKDESGETVLKMPTRLQESLLHPDNGQRLLARTGLQAAVQSEDGLMVLRAANKKELNKALSQLRRIAYHCQWGCSTSKVAALLADKPTKSATSIVVRLAATSSRLHSHEARLNQKVRKLRVGTQAGECQLLIEGIPGISRKHCTITFEPEKAACYVQDMSTNGTYLNGKKLPRPPYKNPQDARVRLFHGDELFFRLKSEDAEELGYVVNILELS